MLDTIRVLKLIRDIYIYPKRKSFSSWGRIKYLYSYMYIVVYVTDTQWLASWRQWMHGTNMTIRLHSIPQISCWNNFRCDWMDIFILYDFFSGPLRSFSLPSSFFSLVICELAVFSCWAFFVCSPFCKMYVGHIKHESIRFIGFYVFYMQLIFVSHVLTCNLCFLGETGCMS